VRLTTILLTSFCFRGLLSPLTFQARISYFSSRRTSSRRGALFLFSRGQSPFKHIQEGRGRAESELLLSPILNHNPTNEVKRIRKINPNNLASLLRVT
jgi:hypothetical protein